MTTDAQDAASIELTAVLVAVTEEEPRVLTIRDGSLLPSGPLESGHRTLQLGLRSWVARQTRHSLGYIEQLYTFADRDRARWDADDGRREPGAGDRVISISYLGLTREARATDDGSIGWQSWYRYLPWEDHRAGSPPLIARAIRPRLDAWAAAAADAATRRDRTRRIAFGFGESDGRWNEDLVLQRYELLYEAELVPEAGRHGPVDDPLPGAAMMHDHRRILATGIARLRTKIKYRPVVFELMPPSFTLLQLQQAVEALAGRRLHKQNFRRLIDQQGLVEETGEMSTESRGRPAKLFRFRSDIMLERAVVGTKLPLSRSP